MGYMITITIPAWEPFTTKFVDHWISFIIIILKACLGCKEVSGIRQAISADRSQVWQGKVSSEHLQNISTNTINKWGAV